MCSKEHMDTVKIRGGSKAQCTLLLYTPDFLRIKMSERESHGWEVAGLHGDSLHPQIATRLIDVGWKHLDIEEVHADMELSLLPDNILLVDTSSIPNPECEALSEELKNRNKKIVIIHDKSSEENIKNIFQNFRLCCIDDLKFNQKMQEIIKVWKKPIETCIGVSSFSSKEQKIAKIVQGKVEEKFKDKPQIWQRVEDIDKKVIGVVVITSGAIMKTEHINYLNDLETKRQSGDILHILVILRAKEDDITKFQRDFPGLECEIFMDHDDEQFTENLDKRFDGWLVDAISKISEEIQAILSSEQEFIANAKEKLSTLQNRLQYWLAILGERETKEQHVEEGDLPDDENEERMMIKPGRGNKADSGVQQDLHVPAGKQAGENNMKAPTEETVGSQEKETKNSKDLKGPGPSSGYASMN